MEEPRAVTARQGRLAIYASLLIAIVAVKLTTGTGSASQPPSNEPSASSSPFAVSDPVPRIAIVYDIDGRGTVGFNELAWEGTKRAADALGADLLEITPKPAETDADREGRLKELAEARYDPIFVLDSTYAGAVARIAPKYRSIWFAIVDEGTVDAPNVIGVQF